MEVGGQTFANFIPNVLFCNMVQVLGHNFTHWQSVFNMVDKVTLFECNLMIC